MLALPPLLPLESLRPRIHFTAPSGWLNDPNGLVYSRGQYHLFYQHNPFGTEWGNMTWGHAVSRDLIHWKDLPNAISPDDLGTIFSGSAVIDKSNTSGFGAPGSGPMVCIYTAAGGTNEASKGKPFAQCLAWSTDGRSFTKYADNPVVAHIDSENRDPKVMWHKGSRQWIMALYLSNQKYTLLGSTDLKQWTRLSDVEMPGTDECPDFIELPLDGNSKDKKWVFWGANGNYRVGDFDGKTFHPSTPIISSHFGNTGYAAQTYSNAPKSRCIQIAWMNNANFPNCAWNQQMAFPNRLELRSTPSGPRLTFWPIEEIRSIRGPSIDAENQLFKVPEGVFDAEGHWEVPASGDLSIIANGIPVVFHRANSTLSVLGNDAPVDIASGRLSLRIVADRTSLEIYAQDGLVHMPIFRLPAQADEEGLRIDSKSTWKGSVVVHQLKSAMER